MEAVDRIEGHNKKDPMLLYLSYQAVHSANQLEAPLQAPQKWINKFQHIKNQGRRKYAAMVAAMDDGVGKVSGNNFKLLLLFNFLNLKSLLTGENNLV